MSTSRTMGMFSETNPEAMIAMPPMVFWMAANRMANMTKIPIEMIVLPQDS